MFTPTTERPIAVCGRHEDVPGTWTILWVGHGPFGGDVVASCLNAFQAARMLRKIAPTKEP